MIIIIIVKSIITINVNCNRNDKMNNASNNTDFDNVDNNIDCDIAVRIITKLGPILFSKYNKNHSN